VSQLYLMLASLVMVSLNGHLLILQVLAHSFEVVPLSPGRSARSPCGRSWSR